MGIIVRERAHESALMEKRAYGCGELEPELQLPCGWEKCLDLKSGLIYFKDWNSGTMTYRDPRQAVPLATPQQRIGLLSISLANASDGAGKKFKRMKVRSDRESSATETTTTTSLSWEEEQSLELSLNLPGTSGSSSRAAAPMNSGGQEHSVCTMEKVRSALERSNWLRPAVKRASPCRELLENNHKLTDTLSTALSLLSSSRESSSPVAQLAQRDVSDASTFLSTSQCSSECFTSPSIMSYEGDDEEVQQQPRTLRGDSSVAKSLNSSSPAEVMMTVGCKSCLMYVMLCKSHPSCPKCGNTDVLLELPAPVPMKKQRVDNTLISATSPTWSWSTA